MWQWVEPVRACCTGGRDCGTDVTCALDHVNGLSWQAHRMLFLLKAQEMLSLAANWRVSSVD